MLFGRVQAKRPEKSLLITGLRGVGKTVLLNEMERMAQGEGYRTILVEAHEEARTCALKQGMMQELLTGRISLL